MSDSENKLLTNEDLVIALDKARTVSQLMKVARAAKKGSPIKRSALEMAREYAGDAKDWTLIRDYYTEGSDGWEYADRMVKTCMERDK